MADPKPRPGLSALDEAVAVGDFEAARQALFDLDPDERRILQAGIGADGVRRAYRSARSIRRGPRLGRVIVLPGLMGTQLDSVDAKGDSDRIWFNAFRVLKGRLDDLRLTLGGDPLPPPHTIALNAMFPKVYLPLLLELAVRWDVRPFAFDWRRDIDVSAAALAEMVKSLPPGEPVHLVAHSMGGLVARRFIQLFPDVWASMQDATGQGRGGRLVMMGTPNRGSFAITLALSGEEKIVKTLAKIDLKHNAGQVLRILNTFHASYQHLPSPRVDLGDDHLKLFDAAAWGPLPVEQTLIDRGRKFQEDLHPVLTPERLVYVAGHGIETPHRVHVGAPGAFTYDQTTDGDGRVPHVLGLLEGVATFTVHEKHGDLPKNARVLAAVHDLLLKGTTGALDVRRGVTRGISRVVGRWIPAEKERVPDEVDTLVAQLAVTRRSGVPTLDQEIAAARLEAIALGDYLGEPEGAVPRGAGSAPARGGGAAPPGVEVSPRPPRLQVAVVWGDITQADGDVYAVGHYQGVLPQAAERALDRALSAGGIDKDHLVLTEHTRRGLLRGDLGDIELFPWPPKKLVAVAGMGHPGTFGEAQLRRLARNLAWSIASLPTPRTICTVLIGAGEGNLSVSAAVGATFRGLADALLDPTIKSRVSRIRIVEMRRDRAREIHDAVRNLAHDPQITQRITLDLEDAVVPGEGGRVSQEETLQLLLETAVKGARGSARSRKALRALLDGLPRERGLRARVEQALDDLGSRAELPSLRLGAGDAQQNIPTRISFVRESGSIKAAAITDTATVAERNLLLDPALVDELVGRMTDPDPAKVPSLSNLTRRLLVPRDFVPLLQLDRPFVFEVDRWMARVHWEMMSSADPSGTPTPLGLWAQVARQLRTAYSPPPAPEARSGRARRALVIGDPGDPAKGHSLPGARQEARRVAEILRGYELDVVEMIGAPDADGSASDGVAPATRIDVLDRLMEGGFDILHYAGHGDFDPVNPDRAGWVFKDGLLTSRELERMDVAPRLVVANACLSGLVSRVAVSGTAVARNDVDLLPGLADEFFRRGVRDYIGTAWEVNDAGAVLFAEVLYEALLGSSPLTLGEAILKARQAVADRAEEYGPLWAAYQHYGDPTARISSGTATGKSAPAKAADAARPRRTRKRDAPKARRPRQKAKAARRPATRS